MRNKGQSIFEIVLAVGFISIVLFALVSLMVQTQRNTSSSKNRADGSRLVQEATEWLRSERDSDWGAFYGRTAGNTTWCLNALGWTTSSACSGNMTDKPFRREVSFTRDIADPNTVRADVLVRWSDSQGNHEIRAATHFTNWRGR